MFVSKHVKFLALLWQQKGYHVEKTGHSRQQLMLSENSIPQVIIPDNSFQTVVNISKISLKLVLNVTPNSTQNISVISFQTMHVIGKTHSRQYLILPEN